MKLVPAITLLLLVYCIFCNGQAGKDQPREKSAPQIVAAAQTKLIKTQGSLPSDNVNSSIQDKAGNLWFGTTSEGLYKYDGKVFSQFTVAHGLSSNQIHCIVEDKDGKIWIGTEAGACLYDGKKFAEIQIPLRKNLPPNRYRNTHNVFSIMQDKRGKLWFATIDGVYIYDGKIFTPFVVNEGAGGFMSSNHNVERILEDKAGNIWLGGRVNEGVFRYDGKSLTNLKVNGNDWACPVFQAKNGDIWFQNWNGAYRYDGQSFIKNDGLSNGPVTRIIEDKKGTLWFGGDGRGLCRFDGKAYTYFTERNGLTNNDVWSILEDRAGNLWIGTRNTGLCCYDGKTFTRFTTTDGQPIKLF
ncbi:ligand-binding sensor domain-containing protein [Spirosoma harenae]